jgi:methylated-DNA-protein-cysteine methyltransferase related protein
MALRNAREELYDLVRKIPKGQVAGYGQLGKLLTSPVSGLIIGKWMASAHADVPWQRVIGADGTMKTFGRGPEFGVEQIHLLEQEGIVLTENRVPKQYFVDWD